MRLITRQTQANALAKIWSKLRFTNKTEEGRKLNKAKELGLEPDVEKFNLIMSNAYTQVHCDECKCATNEAIVFEVDAQDHQDHLVCKSCLEKAIKLTGGDNGGL